MDVPRHRKLRVYSDYGQVRQCLTHPSFELVDEEKDADVLWLNYHFKQYRELSCENPSKRVNQFPFEHVLTVKDLLALVCRRGCEEAPLVDPDSLSSRPPWLPTTYNLQTELPHFVSYYQQRQKSSSSSFLASRSAARSSRAHASCSSNHALSSSPSSPMRSAKAIRSRVLAIFLIRLPLPPLYHYWLRPVVADANL
ncbi:hypothetical protein HPB50_009185 [Hyalomma asiaticum]|uniref:Uncharacterized protein n=1 Tax=Hyalomma asiaticum TaxID=266040 RepID=A0ACB7RNY7_HYAAI|nr:hypothetical protein HPB50_009185 [Hyalomma asiaticum]